ncbi:MAG: hypothetical protein AAF296_07850 [Pseudomonadota bacterium]
MGDFDRDALVAATNANGQKDNQLGFWAVVVALPIIGAMIGGYLLVSEPKAGSVASPVIVSVETDSTSESLDGKVLASVEASDEDVESWSASAELERYSIARRALMECGRVGNFDYEVSSRFTNKNAEAYEKLRTIRSAEIKAGRSERHRQAQQANNEMMVGLLTGETQMRALKQSIEMQQMLAEMDAARQNPQPRVRQIDPNVLTLIGGEPDLAKCTKLKIDVQRGRHDITFKTRS